MADNKELFECFRKATEELNLWREPSMDRREGKPAETAAEAGESVVPRRRGSVYRRQVR